MPKQWVLGNILPWQEEERRRDETLLDGYREDLKILLATPLPSDPTKLLERHKQMADLLQLITSAQSLHEMNQADVIKILHESFFSIAYKQGLEEGRRQVQQINTKCEVCAERRRRNREAAAAARKRQRDEAGEEEEESEA